MVVTKPLFRLAVKIFIVLYITLDISLNLSAQNNTEKPNILWLVSEDNSKHFLNLYDEGGAPMPNIEKLANQGIVFNNAFSNAPVCSVARSTIIAGCYANRVGTQYHRKMKKVPMPEGLKMFPFYLRKAGYYTSNNAKEDYNFISQDDVWDESSKKASYKKRQNNQPFFHVQNFGTTHEGQLHFSEAKMNSNSTVSSKSESPLFPYFPDSPLFRYTNAYYRDLHMKVDNQIGDFLNELEEEGLMDNTIIFYYGDHGGVLPRSKGYIYESGLNVPMVVYIPEKFKHLFPAAKGTRLDAFVQFIDLAPTILNLADVRVPDQMDGKAFLGPGITPENLSKRNTTFGNADRFDEKYDLVRSVRKGKYKYIRNYQPFNIDGLFNFYRYKMLAWKEWKHLFDQGELNDIQSQFFLSRTPEALYNLENDPHEVNNLFEDPSYQNTLLELRKELQIHLASLPDLSFYPESYFLEEALNNPVKFGQQNQEQIKDLIEVADLQLLSFNDSKKRIKKALKSKDPWKRYWGLIVCSSYGETAYSFKKKALRMLSNDKENLVRIRAAEFLSLIKEPIEPNTFVEIVNNAKSETETNLVLNSIALLKTLDPNFKIQLPDSMFPKEWVDKDNDLVNRRIEFINQ